MRLFVGLLTLILPVASSSAAAGQERERVIEWVWRAPTPPEAVIHKGGSTSPTDLTALEIVSIFVKDKPVTLGQPFKAGGEWMRDLRVRVKNVSGKPILRAVLHFGLPETKDRYSPGTLGGYLRYGRSVGGDTDGESQGAFMPGEEFVLTRIEKVYEIDRQFIAERSGPTDIGRVTLDYASVLFDDGAWW